jgi:hypothetical protein
MSVGVEMAETRRDETGTRREHEKGPVMYGARGDRFGVTDTRLRESLPWATARPTLQCYHDGYP